MEATLIVGAGAKEAAIAEEVVPSVYSGKPLGERSALLAEVRTPEHWSEFELMSIGSESRLGSEVPTPREWPRCVSGVAMSTGPSVDQPLAPSAPLAVGGHPAKPLAWRGER